MSWRGTWTALCALGLAAHAAWAGIDRPRPHSLIADTVSISIGVDVAAPWSLLDRHENGASMVLATGTGPLPPESVVFQGVLAPGIHQLELLVDGSREGTVDLVATAPLLPGWPYEENLASQPSSLRLMAEGRRGEVVAARPGSPSREASAQGELVWLDAQGQPLPGWPVVMADLLQALSPRSEPLLVRRGGEDRLLVATKTHLLELNRLGQPTAATALLGLPMGEPVLLPVAGSDDRVLVYVAQGGETSLLEFDATLQHVSGVPLGGSPAWSRPLLGDVDGDGRLDVLMLVSQGGQLRVQVLDGATGTVATLHSMPGLELVSAATGDVNGDFTTDLLLVGRRGPVLALDPDGLLWSHTLAGVTCGAALLADLDGEGRQETALLARQDGGGVQLLLLDADGLPLSASGTPVSAAGGAAWAPQLVRDPSAGARLLLALSPDLGQAATRYLAATLEGQVSDPHWLLPSMAGGPARLLDLDGNGALELVAGDDLGRWAAWPTGWRDPRPTHPLGGAHHGAATVQPLRPGVSPALLCGAVSLAEGCAPLAGVEVEDLAVARGRLTLEGHLVSAGEVWVGPAGHLVLGSTAAIAIPASPIPVHVEGRLELRGAGANVASLPENSTQTTANALLSLLDLRPAPSGHLLLRDCLIHSLPAPLAAPTCSLTLEDSWLLAGAQGLTAEGAVVSARDCLFQPAPDGLRFLAGSQVEMEGCVITSGEGTAMLCQGASLAMRDCQFLACGDALAIEDGVAATLDSVHFQGNERDLRLGVAHGPVAVQACDFMESHLVSVLNQSAQAVTAIDCYWEAERPVQGPVVRVDDRLSPVQPVVIPRPVFSIEAGPMVDGDEPLEWAPVTLSVGGIPIAVEYRVYRSDSAYDLVKPENLVAVTSLTQWRDPDFQPRCFYCVTASFGKQVVE